MSCLQSFTKEEILNEHKKQCLLIDGCQAVNCDSGTIKFTNYGKQIPTPFKIYAETECFLKRINSYETEHTIKYQEHIPNSISAKLVVLMIDLLYLLLFLKEKVVLMNLLRGFYKNLNGGCSVSL